MIPTILLLVMFLAVTGLVVRERLWGGMLRFFNVLVAATMATAWYEPLAALGDPFVNRIVSPFGQFFDAAAAWALFVVILVVLRIITWLVSRTRVPFPPLLDWGGGAVMASLHRVGGGRFHGDDLSHGPAVSRSGPANAGCQDVSWVCTGSSVACLGSGRLNERPLRCRRGSCLRQRRRLCAAIR